MKYSIITVCRNNLQGLKNTFNSIISQTCKDYEWIVIDGDSNDGTKEWLSNLSKEHKWISEADAGLFYAMNKGMSLASGEYLIFMNSGDGIASSSILEKVNKIIQEARTPPSFIYGDSIDFLNENKEFYKKARLHKTIWRGMFTQHQAMFFRRNNIGRIKYNEKLRYSADYGFICEYLISNNAIKSNGAVKKVNLPVCRFLLGGINETKRVQALFDDFRIRQDVLKQSSYVALLLFFFHYCHLMFKRICPDLMRRLRYDKK